MTRQPWTLTSEMFLSVPEVEQLLRDLRERAAEGGLTAILDDFIVEALLFSGLRNSEFCRLTLRDTAIGQGPSVFVVRHAQDERTVQIPEAVSALLRRYLALARPNTLLAGADLDEPLILNERGRPYERTGLYRRVVRTLTRAGLGERASVQLLRHTYGYLAYLRTGGNLLFVQRQLGHAHPMITSVYARFVPECPARAAEQVYLPSPPSGVNERVNGGTP